MNGCIEWWWYGWLHDTYILMMHLQMITYFSGNGQCMERCFQYFSFFFLLPLIQQLVEKYPLSIDSCLRFLL